MTIRQSVPPWRAPTWDDPASHPLDDLKAAMRLVSGASGWQANFICMGSAAGDAFEKNPNVQAAYDKRFIQPGVISPQALDDLDTFGMTALGTYRQIPLFVNEQQYEDASGLHYYCPPKSVLIAADGIQNTLAYAAIAQPNDDESGIGPIEGTRIPYIYWSKSEEVRLFSVILTPSAGTS